MVECKECGAKFPTDRSLHAHLKRHSLKIKDYYYKYFPRRDKYDNELIKFVNKESYFATDFNNKNNLKKWMTHVEPPVAKEYFKNFLVGRKEKKDLEFAPCQVELRSLMSPSVSYYQKVLGDYNSLCEEIGLTILEPLEYNPESYTEEKIYVDTREQNPLEITDYPTEVRGLKYGDYALSNKDKTCNCYIERKSIQDLIGTLSGGYNRFCDEIERAETEDANLIVLVESDYNASLMFHKLKRTYKNIRTNPQHIFHNIRTIIQEYPNVQFLFVKNREEYKNVDLQYAYDLKLL